MIALLCVIAVQLGWSCMRLSARLKLASSTILFFWLAKGTAYWFPGVDWRLEPEAVYTCVAVD